MSADVVIVSATKYEATAGDLAFKEAMQEDADDFTLALLMQRVSAPYLAVMAHDHSIGDTASFRSMIDAEIARRGTAEAQRANNMAKFSLAIAVCALAVAIGDAVIGWAK